MDNKMYNSVFIRRDDGFYLEVVLNNVSRHNCIGNYEKEISDKL